MVELSGLRQIARWLPVAMEAEEIATRIENVRLRPQGVPQTMEDMLLTQALARQALLVSMRRMRRHFWDSPGDSADASVTPSFDLVLASGGALAHAPQDGLVALTLLDAIQPTGLSRLVIDWASIWCQMGAVARLAPLAAAQVLERDGFRELGTVIAPIGQARDGERALSLRIIRDDGEVMDTEVMAGTIRCFPLALSEAATIEVRPSRHFDVGLGQKGLGGRARVRGGTLGVIVDARGRPLALPHNLSLCRTKLQDWLGSLIHTPAPSAPEASTMMTLSSDERLRR